MLVLGRRTGAHQDDWYSCVNYIIHFTGWVKTLDTYFNDQVRGILDNMVIKLEAYPKMKFMYAEMSFFSMWWNQIDQYKKNKVKK